MSQPISTTPGITNQTTTTTGPGSPAQQAYANQQSSIARQNMANQMAAPLAGTQSMPDAMPALPPLTPLTPLTAPTQRPQEPQSLGMPFGDTPGPEILNLPNPIQTQYVSAKSVIDEVANAIDASPMMKYLSQRTGQVF